ncbi:MAG TPA: hypothetical protein VNX23_24130 [Bradyrhizobium sp.]|uniref:hypothetical protein n=1 Tax=Bradyrhizobium sp. TaxID=376 RepID=UPI002C963354|nr:hypothetical protein [Bradyrhizobium sp.]HXB80456.1 hypothetical protein [Bradyrhizobium sp.]
MTDGFQFEVDYFQLHDKFGDGVNAAGCHNFSHSDRFLRNVAGDQWGEDQPPATTAPGQR